MRNKQYILVFFSFIESLLSLKKSRLLQLLDNEETGLIANLPETFNNTPSLKDTESDAVSIIKQNCF